MSIMLVHQPNFAKISNKLYNETTNPLWAFPFSDGVCFQSNVLMHHTFAESQGPSKSKLFFIKNLYMQSSRKCLCICGRVLNYCLVIQTMRKLYKWFKTLLLWVLIMEGENRSDIQFMKMIQLLLIISAMTTCRKYKKISNKKCIFKLLSSILH